MATNTNQTFPMFPLNPRAVLKKYLVNAGQTAPEAGQLVVEDDGGEANYVELPDNGDGDTRAWAGVMAEELRAVTASVDGIILVWDAESTSFRGKANTSGNLADSLRNTRVTLDVSSNNQTIDENDTTNGALFIEDFDVNQGTVDFRIDVQERITGQS